MAQPCPNPVPRLVLIEGGIGIKTFSTESIDVPHPQVTRAIAHIHGAGRNADEYFCWAYESYEIEYPLGNPEVFIVALNFQILNDNPLPNELYWTEPGWKTGYDSENPGASISSFTVLGFIVEQKFLNPALFPNLQQITLSGHSAGGQFMNRYSEGTRIQPPIPTRYIPANPSTYAYLMPQRPFTGTLDAFTMPSNPPANYNEY